MHLIVFLIIGGIAGALAGRVVSGHGYGVLMDVVVGPAIPGPVGHRQSGSRLSEAR